MFESIADNDLKQLKRVAESQKPSHAYLFTGAKDEKLSTAAIEFICELINSAVPNQNKSLLFTRMSEGLYPDLFSIHKDNLSVKVESIRRIQGFLQMKAQENPYRYVIVHNSETMGEVAQNSLLKIFEEPVANGIIFLLSETQDALLPTILSRARTIKLAGDGNAVRLNAEEIEYCINKIEEIILAGSINAIFEFAAALTKDKNKVNDYLEFLLYLFKDIIFSKSSGAFDNRFERARLISEKISTQCAFNILRHIKNTNRYIKQNASLLLAAEAMLINIQEEYHAENSRGTI